MSLSPKIAASLIALSCLGVTSLGAQDTTELERPVALALLKAHFTQVGPTLADSLGDGVTVTAVIQVDQFTREARYSINGLGFTAMFRRSDVGWMLVQYGYDLKPLIAILYGLEIERRYTDLNTVLNDAWWALSAWSGPSMPSNFGSMSDVDKLRELNRGATHQQAQAVLDSAGVFVPDGYEWGLVQGTLDTYGVLWVGDGTAKCAHSYEGVFADDPPALYTNVPRYGSYCYGRGESYTSTKTLEAIQEILEGMDGIIMPGWRLELP